MPTLLGRRQPEIVHASDIHIHAEPGPVERDRHHSLARVFADVTGQFKSEIYPESETRSFAVDQDVDFVFSPGDGGKITGFVVSVGSNATYKAKRVE